MRLVQIRLAHKNGFMAPVARPMFASNLMTAAERDISQDLCLTREVLLFTYAMRVICRPCSGATSPVLSRSDQASSPDPPFLRRAVDRMTASMGNLIRLRRATWELFVEVVWREQKIVVTVSTSCDEPS